MMRSLRGKLGGAPAASGGSRKPVKSLLLSPQEAATIDSASLLDAANAALHELSSGTDGDPRLADVSDTLFGPSSVSFERELHTPEENARLDDSIAAFLRLLSPHFPHHAAHQVLEFLLRRYAICDRNVDAVVECILPHHDTPVFARVVQQLELEGSAWRFLDGTKKSGVVLPRAALAKRCTNDSALREFIFGLVRRAADNCASAPLLALPAWERHFAFFAATLTECISVMVNVGDGFVRQLLPQLVHGLACARVPQYQAAMIMVAAQLCAKCALPATATESLLCILAKHSGPGTAPQTLMFTIAVIDSQTCPELPLAAFRHLVKIEGLVSCLEQLSTRCDTARLVAFMFEHLVEHVPQHDNYERVIKALIAANLPKPGIAPFAATATARLLRLRDDSDVTVRDRIHRVLSRIAQRHAVEFDQGMQSPDALLERGDARAEEAGALPLSNEPFARLMAIHEPIGDLATALQVALDHHDPQVRVHAVQRVAEADIPQETTVTLKHALLRRLADDDPRVVRGALQKDVLVILRRCCSTSELILSGVDCCRRWSDNVQKKPKRSVPVVEASLRFLSGLLASDELIPDETAMQLVSTFIEHLPCTYASSGRAAQTRSHSLSLVAVRCAARVPHWLFDGLKAIQLDADGDDSARAPEVASALATAIVAAAGNDDQLECVRIIMLGDAIVEGHGTHTTRRDAKWVLFQALDKVLERVNANEVGASSDWVEKCFGPALVHQLVQEGWGQNTSATTTALASLAGTLHRLLNLLTPPALAKTAMLASDPREALNSQSIVRLVLALHSRAPNLCEPLLPTAVKQAWGARPLEGLALLFSSSAKDQLCGFTPHITVTAQVQALAVAATLVHASLTCNERMCKEICDYGAPGAFVALAHPHRVRVQLSQLSVVVCSI